MDTFPTNINRTDCLTLLKYNQNMLVRTCRQVFSDLIDKEINECHTFVDLVFDKRLWNESKKIICKELLERFQEIKLKRRDGKLEVIMLVNSNNFSSVMFEDVVSLIIEFL